MNIGDFDIDIGIDISEFLAALRAQLAAARRLAGQQGNRIGDALKKDFTKSVEGMMGPLDSMTGMLAKPAGMAALAPVANAAASAVTALAGSLLNAASSAGSLAPLLPAMGAGIAPLIISFKGLGDAIGGDEEAMKKLGPAAQGVVGAVNDLKGPWGELKSSIQETTLAGVGDSMKNLSDAILPSMSTQMQRASGQTNSLITGLMDFLATDKMVGKFNSVLKGSVDIFAVLKRAAKPAIEGITTLLQALQPSGERTAGTIVKMARAFRDWAEAGKKSGSIADYMEKAQNSMQQVWRVVKNLGKALWNVLQLGSDEGDGMIKSLGDMAVAFRKFTESGKGQKDINNWFTQGLGLLKQLWTVVSPLITVFQTLFDPGLMGMFTQMLADVAPMIKPIIDILKGTLVPIFQMFGQALQRNMPKIAGLFVALGPLLKGIGAVIGNLISQGLDFIGMIAGFITPIVGAISNWLGPIIEKFAPVIASLIWAFTNWGGSLIRMVPIIGKFAAPLFKFADFLWEKVNMFVGFALRILWPVIRTVFGGIMRGLGIARNIIGRVFGWVIAYFRTAFNIYRGILTRVWEVIKGVFEVVKGAVLRVFGFFRAYFTTMFNIYRTIFTTVFNVIRGVVTRFVNGVRTVIEFFFGALPRFFSNIWGRVTGVIRTVWEHIWGFLSGIFQRIFDKIKGIPLFVIEQFAGMWQKMKDVGTNIIQGIIDGIKAMIGKVGDAVSGVVDTITGFWPFSPAKMGPLRIHPPEDAGENVTRLFAEGMVKTDIGKTMDRWMRPIPGILTPAANSGQQQPANRSTSFAVNIGNVTAAEPRATAQQIVRTMRDQTYLMGQPA